MTLIFHLCFIVIMPSKLRLFAFLFLFQFHLLLVCGCRFNLKTKYNIHLSWPKTTSGQPILSSSSPSSNYIYTEINIGHKPSHRNSAKQSTALGSFPFASNRNSIWFSWLFGQTPRTNIFRFVFKCAINDTTVRDAESRERLSSQVPFVRTIFVCIMHIRMNDTLLLCIVRDD